MMKSAELGNRDDLSDTQHLTRKWTLFSEPKVGPRRMVVLEIRRQCFFQMLGTEDHKVVQALSSNRADKALGVRILPGTLMRCQDFFGAQRSDPQANLSTVDAASVSNQIAGRFSVTEGL